MHSPANPMRGVTLIELMVTLAVLAILMVAAIPTFSDFRQRSVIRGAADQVASFWGDARFEALRRNSLVKVGAVRTTAGAFCLGAATTTTTNDDSACDCFSPVSATAGKCNISVYPQDQSQWRGARMVDNPQLGDTDTDLQGVAVIDPKRGNITESADAGNILLRAPAGLDFRLNVNIDRNGRAVICEPNATGMHHLPQYTNRRC